MPPKHKKSSASTIRSPEVARSPAPKDLKRKKSNGKIIFFGLLVSVGLIMLACFLDYQQSMLMSHTSRLPKEVQVATKYVVDLAKKVPHKVEVLLDSAKGQMIVITANMHIGDKTVAQLLFGVDEEEEDPTPEDVLEDLKLEDEVDDLIKDELHTDIVNHIVEEVEEEEKATLLRKEEELRVFEENRRKMKEEALKAIWEEAARSALMEEQEKVKIKNDEAKSIELFEEGKERLQESITENEAPMETSNSVAKVDEKQILDKEASNETSISSAKVAEKEIEAEKSALLVEKEKVKTKNEEETFRELLEEDKERFHGSITNNEASIETSNSVAKVDEKEIADKEASKETSNSSAKVAEKEVEASKSALLEEQEKVKTTKEEATFRELLEEGKERFPGSITDNEVSIETSDSVSKVAEKEIDVIEGENVDVDATSSESKKFKEDKDPTPTDVLEELKFEDEVDGFIDDELLTNNDNQIIDEVEVEELATLKRKEEEPHVVEDNRGEINEDTLKAIWEEADKSLLLEEQKKVKVKNEEAISREGLEEGKKRDHESTTDKEALIETLNSTAKVAEEEIDDIEEEWVEGVDAFPSEPKKFKGGSI